MPRPFSQINPVKTILIKAEKEDIDITRVGFLLPLLFS
ncbi:hypothetical protein DSOL_1214 [Desulfosporosinus metallidurans]|uniref:Uncharacterized protein n=1 Tax=Desulfosporosinus metallidurans TaxID=1888891 RepID=A0A1Q8QZH2_9FIRM|nr:hypothetical protein DSOL_1214 [Desulfosporosinus metallidurans]